MNAHDRFLQGANAAVTGPGTLHVITVGWVPDNHGYPYRATCACGWSSRTYAAKHAAQAMGDEHVTERVDA